MSGSNEKDNMFPSSDPAIQIPATSQGEEVDWRAPDYPGDQQNMQWQTIAGNGPGNYDTDLDDELFGDDGVELGPGDDFAPGGWSTNDQRLADPAFEQRAPEPPPGYRHAQTGPPQPETHYSYGHLQGPNGNRASFHASATNYNDLTITDKNREIHHYEPDPAYQAPPRQQSLRPNPPYSGYARNAVSATPGYQGASDIPRPRGLSSNLEEYFSDEEGGFQRAFDVFKSHFFNGGKAAGALPSSREDVNETPYASVESLRAAPPQKFWAPHVLEDEEELLEEDDDAEGLETGQDIQQPRPSLTGSRLEARGFETGQDSKRRRPSPTESELAEQGFEFHSELEEEQIARFNDKAFRKALREVRPELPRKQQWYAYQRVADMLADEARPTEYDGYDPLQPQRDFPVETTEPHHVCQCGGDPTKCFCVPGHCGCSACPRNESVDEKPSGGSEPTKTRQAHVEDDHDDAPMDIGTTLITPRFPSVYNQHGIQKIPGLGQLQEESEDEAHSPSKPTEQNHRCQCGDDCRCPPGGCQCAKLDDVAEPPQYNPNRLAQHPLGSLIKKAAESQPSSPLKTGFPTPSQHDARQTDPPSSTHERPYYTPQQGFSFVRSNHSSEASTPLGTPPQITPIPPSRPDTPRPHDTDVRESVEPEMPMPNWHRESTPAYTDRSLSPSPTSRSPISRHGDFDLDRADGIDDVDMRDITPTVPASRAYHRSRERSMAPGSPTSFSRSRLSVPRTSSPTMASSPTRHMMPAARSPRSESRPSSPRRLPDRDDIPGPDDTPGQATPHARHPIPAPPIPSSTAPGLKTTKQRGKRKSAVQGGKVEKPKSRNVTAKQTRKATEKIVRQDAKDTKEGKTKGKGKVAEAVARIEAGLQVDGTPTRRSKRVKDRVASGSPVPDYKAMGG